MPYRGPKAFPIFVDVLKEDYEWLADDLEEALTLKTEDVTDEVETDELIGNLQYSLHSLRKSRQKFVKAWLHLCYTYQNSFQFDELFLNKKKLSF